MEINITIGRIANKQQAQAGEIMAIDWVNQRYQEMEEKAFGTNYSFEEVLLPDLISSEFATPDWEWERQADDAYHYSISKRLDRFIDEHEYRENLIA